MNPQQDIYLRIWWLVGMVCACAGVYLLSVVVTASIIAATGATLLAMAALIFGSVIIAHRM